MVAPRARFYEPLLIGLLSLDFGIVFFDRNAVNFLMPFMQPDLRLSNTEVGLIASAFSLTWAAAGIVIGGLSDRRQIRKPILVALTIGFAACSFVTGFAVSFLMLFLTRLTIGIFEGAVLPISQSLTAAEVAPSRRGLAMGIMQNFGSNVLGSTAASLILVNFAIAYGWRDAFFLAGIPAFILALAMWRYLQEPRRSEKVQGVPAERLTLTQALERRNIVICLMLSVLMVSLLVICFAFMPLYLTKMRGLAPGDMGWLIAALGVAAAIAGFVVPGLSDWIGRKPVMVVTPLLGLLVPLGALFYHGSFWGLAVIMAIGWAAIGTFPLFMAIIPSETVDPRHTATTLGLIQGAGEGIGGVLAPTLAGAAADRFGLDAPLWVMAVLPVLVAVLALSLRETSPRRLGLLRPSEGVLARSDTDRAA